MESASDQPSSGKMPAPTPLPTVESIGKMPAPTPLPTVESIVKLKYAAFAKQMQGDLQKQIAEKARLEKAIAVIETNMVKTRGGLEVLQQMDENLTKDLRG